MPYTSLKILQGEPQNSKYFVNIKLEVVMLNFKKLLIGFIALILTLGIYAIAANAEEIDDKKGVVTGSAVNFRKEPNTSAEIFATLTKGTQVDVLESSGEWYKIHFDGSIGWMYALYLKVESVEAVTGKVTASVLNVRNQPSTSSKIEGKLFNAQTVRILSKSGQWYMLKTPDSSIGWVYSEYVALDKPLTEINETTSRDNILSRGVEFSRNSAIGEEIAEYSKKFLGVPYKWGGATPDGFDCSGLTYYIYKQFGITLNRTAEGQSAQGVYVDKSELKPGDLIFFDTNGTNDGEVTHDGMYIGNNQFIHSANSRTLVSITDLSESYYSSTYVKAKRIIK